MLRLLKRLFHRKNKKKGFPKERFSKERQDSGEYQIVINGKYVYECTKVEIIKSDSFFQEIKTFFDVEETEESRSITLIDKVSKRVLSYRILPYKVRMFASDTVDLTWTLSIENGQMHM